MAPGYAPSIFYEAHYRLTCEPSISLYCMKKLTAFVREKSCVTLRGGPSFEVLKNREDSSDFDDSWTV